MNKKIVLVGIAVLVIFVSFGGCTDSNGSSQYEIVNYSIKTYWHDGMGSTWKEHIEDGFYHNIPEDATVGYTYYEISGTIKNTCNERIDIQIGAIFYDKNGIELFRGSEKKYSVFDGDAITNLPPSYNESFTIKLYENRAGFSCQYWFEVASFDFDISTS